MIETRPGVFENEVEHAFDALLAALNRAAPGEKKDGLAALRARLASMGIRHPDRDIYLALVGALERRASTRSNNTPWRKGRHPAPKSNPGGYK